MVASQEVANVAKRDLYIDADHILYLCAFSSSKKSGFEDGGDILTCKNCGSFVAIKDIANVGTDRGDYVGVCPKCKNDSVFEDHDDGMSGFGAQDETPTVDITDDVVMFKNKVIQYRDIAQVECMFQGWEFGRTYVIMSDDTNFRFKLTDTYKKKRASDADRTEGFIKLREWARDYYGTEFNTEADDVVSHYAREGNIVFTTDKDVFKGAYGIFFNCHMDHMCWIETPKRSARRFTLLQTLMGDTVDNIVGIPNVGVVTATSLLNRFGWCWDGVVKAYEHNGLSEEDAILNRRLVGMDQWHPDKGVMLWYPS